MTGAASVDADEPLVAVVVPAYQAERYLEATLAAIRAQDYGNWCGVLVDDGSTDDTGAIVARACRDDDRFRAVSQANAGVSAARNTGLRSLPPGAGLLVYVDSDDLLLPGALSTLVAALSRRPDAVAAHGWAELIDEDGRPTQPGRHRAVQSERPTPDGVRTRLLAPDEDTDRASLLLSGTVWPPATALLRTDVVRRVGGWDPGLVVLEDWDLWLRMSREGPVVFVDEQVAWYRRHDVNATNRTALCTQSAQVVRAKAWSSATDRVERRMVAASGLRVLVWELLLHRRRAVRMMGERRPLAVLWCLVRMLAVVARMVVVRPVVAPLRVIEMMTGVDERLGFDASGDRYEAGGAG